MHIATSAAQLIGQPGLQGVVGLAVDRWGRQAPWGPWRVAHRVVASDAHACRPCGQDGCGGGKVSECLTTLPVARVHAALAELVAQTRDAVR